jgi:hypothetical protein
LREVFAKKPLKTDSALPDPHLGHLMRLRSRSLMVIVNENFFLQPPQRKSYVGIGTLLQAARRRGG